MPLLQKTIRVPLSVLSYKVLTTEYFDSLLNGEPLLVKSSDPMAAFFSCQKPTKPQADKLPKALTFTLVGDFARFVSEKNIWAIGTLLNTLHRQMYLQKMQEAKRYGVEVTKAIAIFCEHYGIAIDIDISFDALYKAYQRQEKAHPTEKLGKKIIHKKLPKNRINDSVFVLSKSDFVPSEIELYLMAFEVKYPQHFKTKKGLPLKSIQKQMRCYAIHHFGGLSVVQTARHQKMPINRCHEKITAIQSKRPLCQALQVFFELKGKNDL